MDVADEMNAEAMDAEEAAMEPVDVVRLREGRLDAHGQCATCGLVFVGYEVHGCDVARLEAKLDAQETLLRGLIVALRGGAVGKWTP